MIDMGVTVHCINCGHLDSTGRALDMFTGEVLTDDNIEVGQKGFCAVCHVLICEVVPDGIRAIGYGRIVPDAD